MRSPSVGSLRLALRLARRDIAAHRARSALIVTMIGLPVLLLVAALTLGATAAIDEREALPATLGAAEARIVAREGVAVEQDATGSAYAPVCQDGGMTGATPTFVWNGPIFRADVCPTGAVTASALPGVGPDPTVAELTSGIETLTGATATPVGSTQVGYRVDGLTRWLTTLDVDGRTSAASGMVTLESGRWPVSPDEVLVTRAALDEGFPDHGEITVRIAGVDDDRSATVTVVGRARTTPRPQDTPSLVRLPDDDTRRMTFLLERDRPFGWEEVQALGRHGLAVTSRALVEDPSAANPTPAVDGLDEGDAGTAQLVTVAAVGLLLQGCLVAGPAFVVIASRRRRDMALLAATGARVSDLRLILLGQGVLLGALAAVVGAALGVAAAWTTVAATSRWWPGRRSWGLFDVPVGPVALIAVAAVIAALVSAVLPARGLGRLDLRAAVEADGAPAPEPRRTHTAVGVALLLVGVGSFVLTLILTTGVVGSTLSAVIDSRRLWASAVLVLLGGCALVGGALLLVPVALRALAAASSRWPLLPRMAIRDVYRQHRRAAPTVAAVMGSAILIGGLGVIAWSAGAQARQLHVAVAPQGQAVVPVRHGDLEARLAQVEDAAPGSIARLVATPSGEVQAPAGTSAIEGWATLPTGCPVDSLDARGTGATIGCPGATGPAIFSDTSLLIVSPDDAADLLGLSDADRDVLDAGGVLVTSPEHAPDGQVTLASLRVTFGGEQDETVVLDSVTRVARTITAPRNTLGYDIPGAIVGDVTAERLGMRWDRGILVVGSAEGPLPPDQARTLESLPATDLRDPVMVERGAQDPLALLWTGAAVVFGLLIVVAVVTATALSQGEARRDLAVLTAVGARAGFARRLAAVQAGGLAGAGTILGMAVALPPALTVVLSATSSLRGRGGAGAWIDLWDSATVVVPWGWMALLVLAVCVVAAAVAAAITRPSPALSRRAT